MAPKFLTVADGALKVAMHWGQVRAWDSVKRFVCVLAGTQGGKTEWGCLWLLREVQTKGPGDYMVVAPTFPLLKKKLLPVFRRVFETVFKLGVYRQVDRIFTFSRAGEVLIFGAEQEEPTQIFFGYAEDPESLESATAKAAWLDEAGQKKFRLGSWEAVLRRLSIHMGRALITTTPYDLGWLKQQVHDRAVGGDPDYELVRFESIDNPAFPRAEWERALATLPRWKFDLFYRAIFTRPAGVIYDSFIDEYQPTGHKCKPFRLPDTWHRFVGIDFGGINTVALFYALDPSTRRLYLYREYRPQEKRTAAQHVEAMLTESDPFPYFCAGGSKSEDQWRDEFAAGGLGVNEPAVMSVEVGIDRVYGLHRSDDVIVFDTCTGYLDEKGAYARKLGPDDRPTDEIENKHSFHFMDAERYILGHLADPTPIEGADRIDEPETIGEFQL